MKHSIATRYGILLATMTALVGCCVLLVNIYYLERYAQAAIDEGQQHISDAVEQQLIRDAQLVAKSLANSLDTAVYNSDFSAIQEQLEALSHNSDIAYTYIYNLDGTVIHDGTTELIHYGRHISELLPAGLPITLASDTRKIGEYIHIAHPVRSGGTTFAILRLAITYTEAETDIQEMSADLAQQGRELRNNIVITSLTMIVLLLVAAMTLIFFVSQRLLSPIRRLVEQCRRYATGDNQIQFKLERDDEFGLLGEALEEMKDSINQSHSQVQKLAYHDPLTELPNRRMFNEELSNLLDWADRHDNRIAVLFIDLDHFKQVNDVAGHEVGDKLLIQAAKRLTHLLVEEAETIDFPIPENLLLARLGGDEFVMMLPNFKDEAHVNHIANRIVDTLYDSFTVENRRYTISASIGITLFPEHGRSVTELLKQADIAMYAAKQSGRKRHRFFEPQMINQVVNEMIIQQGARDAMQRNEFSLAYQPIVDMDSGDVVGAETLIRWNHPEQGPIAPDYFIPLIEHTDQIMPLTQWILERACQDLIQHIMPKRSRFKLSVNISGAILRDPGTRDKIRNVLEQYQLPAHTLHLELTETSMVENIQSCAETLRYWKQVGADIWIDDFGTGYSSLGYLHALPIDGLKIDRSFINKVSHGQGNQVIETIITLANSMGIETVSEGIETESQKDFIHSRGGRYAQGYLYAKPAPLKQLLKLLDKETIYESL